MELARGWVPFLLLEVVLRLYVEASSSTDTSVIYSGHGETGLTVHLLIQVIVRLGQSEFLQSLWIWPLPRTVATPKALARPVPFILPHPTPLFLSGHMWVRN